MTWFSRCSSYFAEFAIGSVKRHDSPGYKMDLMLDDESRLEVCAQSGLVGGMQDFVSAKHRTAWQAWAKLWADMYSAGLLSVDVGH